MEQGLWMLQTSHARLLTERPDMPGSASSREPGRSAQGCVAPRVTSLPRPAVVTVAQMREIDRLMVETAGIGMVQMMENAGRALAGLARRLLGGDLRGRRLVVLVGSGGNGGGGLVAARRASGWGAEVDVITTVPLEMLRDVPARQLRALAETAVRVHAEPDRSADRREGAAIAGAVAAADLVIDAIIGYGLRGAPTGYARELVDVANAAPAPVLALDVPSGLDADTGHPAWPTVRADATVTLALPKAGLLTPAARGYVGELYVADIAVPPAVARRVGADPGDLFAAADVVRLAVDPDGA